ncbi:MAG: hypothetical protein HOK58_06200, partial [Acidimicrobiaceae bacterium]|nr:hypothetical protein [Acidimicrobiaceae bacterium]
MFLLITAVVGLRSAPSTAQEIAHRQVVLYTAPMLTAVIDPFRPPVRIGAPGNRGLEYGSSDNQVVAAAADGYVLFAGPVAGRKVISI